MEALGCAFAIRGSTKLNEQLTSDATLALRLVVARHRRAALDSSAAGGTPPRAPIPETRTRGTVQNPDGPF